ncbi:hypothetical protein Tco_1070870 [Tanacetum coccineum]|uniref:Uncharacterized protein n=1 Tax=Tanacetum coccineum TaxID=301880 RepID=A0ABQ5HPS2_9ASTR
MLVIRSACPVRDHHSQIIVSRSSFWGKKHCEDNLSELLFNIAFSLFHATVLGCLDDYGVIVDWVELIHIVMVKTVVEVEDCCWDECDEGYERSVSALGYIGLEVWSEVMRIKRIGSSILRGYLGSVGTDTPYLP